MPTPPSSPSAGNAMPTPPSSPSAGNVQCTFDGPIASVTLDNPDKLGAMTRAMWAELRRVFLALADYAPLRAVLVSGAGAHFCAGGDISEYPGFRFDPASLHDFHEREVWGALSAMQACDVPVIAAIEGACMGAGMEIAACCDIRIASDSARFGAPIAKLGFPMAPREAQLVAREAGLPTAREMLLEAATFDATEMKARGFLNAVVATDHAYQHALRRAQHLQHLAPLATRRHKALLRTLANPEFESNQPPAGTQPAAGAIENTVPEAYRYAPEAEHREGIAAFLEKRRPRFVDG